MHLTTHLMMMMMAAVACRAAFIPNMMFASGRSRLAQQAKPLAQHQQSWRAGNPLSPWDDGTETYGYLADRHTNMMDDMTAGFQQQPQLQQSQQPLVYGVAHRYLSEQQSPSYPVQSPTDELYNNELYNNALLMRGRGPFNAIKRSSLPNYYDASMDDDMGNIDDGMSMASVDDYEQPISRQDVINFEKYVQRFFQQQPSERDAEMENQYSDDWSLGSRMDDNEVGDNYNDIDNDEEAARQLHLLLTQQKQQRRPIALREIQKKNVALGAVTKAPTRTETPVTTATTTTTSSATLALHLQNQHHQGQKEEPLLRPPSPQRQPPQMSTTTATPPALAKTDVENNSIYHTIQRLMNMHNRLQKSSQDEGREASTEEEEDNDTNSRAKRFVAPSQDSLLSKQIHSLDKIKA
ncbi:uncharacterized protein LOC130685535 [Daphnia carinata]|uniref:uncharacterized protein LOC130685535 n=1 Tax=Daphnia carinata TaxID=120202 RepID=UPI00257DF053|nr:uncharacterized protein LOC130685535 [Daphnia carinata]